MFLNARMHGGNTPPATPRINCGEERVGEGGKGRKGLARFGNRWPSGARSTQPSQTVQVAGRRHAHTSTREHGTRVN
jgi:hypothetical protein